MRMATRRSFQSCRNMWPLSNYTFCCMNWFVVRLNYLQEKVDASGALGYIFRVRIYTASIS